jgi:hypothetical protein
VIVWLWDALGPARTTRGVSGDHATALQAAEACLLTGEAHAARVEQAVAILGTETLTSSYRRTGNGWHARRSTSGITWKPFMAGVE